MPQTPLVATHTYACYYHPATILFLPPPHPKPKILYETLPGYDVIMSSLSLQ